MEKEAIDDFDLSSVKIKGKLALFFVHFWALFIKRLQYFKRDKKGLCCEIFMPCAIVGVGLCITLITFIYESPPLKMYPGILPTPINLPVQDPYRSYYYQNANFPGNYFNYLSTSSINNNDISRFDQYVFDERNINENGFYGAYFINDLQKEALKLNYYAFVSFYYPKFTNIFFII